MVRSSVFLSTVLLTDCTVVFDSHAAVLSSRCAWLSNNRSAWLSNNHCSVFDSHGSWLSNNHSAVFDNLWVVLNNCWTVFNNLVAVFDQHAWCCLGNHVHVIRPHPHCVQFTVFVSFPWTFRYRRTCLTGNFHGVWWSGKMEEVWMGLTEMRRVTWLPLASSTTIASLGSFPPHVRLLLRWAVICGWPMVCNQMTDQTVASVTMACPTIGSSLTPVRLFLALHTIGVIPSASVFATVLSLFRLHYSVGCWST